MGEIKNASKVLLKTSEGKRSLGRLRHRWKDIFEIGLTEIACGMNSSG
jgi:hypothetical protein